MIGAEHARTKQGGNYYKPNTRGPPLMLLLGTHILFYRQDSVNEINLNLPISKSKGFDKLFQ